VDISMAWESVAENMKASATAVISKLHIMWFPQRSNNFISLPT